MEAKTTCACGDCRSFGCDPECPTCWESESACRTCGGEIPEFMPEGSTECGGCATQSEMIAGATP